MLAIKAIVFDNYETIRDMRLNENAAPLPGYIAVTLSINPGKTFYLNKDKIATIVIDDDQQAEMYNFIESPKVKIYDEINVRVRKV